MSKGTLSITPPDKKKKLYKFCGIGLCFLAILLVIYYSFLKDYFTLSQLEWLEQKLKDWADFAPLIFLAIGTLCMGLGVPRSVLSFLAGGAFGFWFGLLLGEIVQLAGASIVFFSIRWTRQKFLPEIWEMRLTAVDRHMEAHGFATTLLMRQIPLPGIAINTLLGLSRIRMKNFLLASALGFLPQNIVFTLYGSGLQEDFLARSLMATTFLIAMSVTIYLVYRYSATARELKKQVAQGS